MRKSTGPIKPLVMPDDLSGSSATQSEATKKCPHCGASITGEAARCPQCGKDLPAATAPKTDAWDGYDI